MDINRHFLLDSSFNFSIQCMRFQPCRTPQVSVTPSAKKRSFRHLYFDHNRWCVSQYGCQSFGAISCIMTQVRLLALRPSVIVISLLYGGFYTMVWGYARHQYARPPPRKRYNYYITCYLGNTTLYCFGALKLLWRFNECMPSCYTDLMKMANDKKSITEGKIHLVVCTGSHDVQL